MIDSLRICALAALVGLASTADAQRFPVDERGRAASVPDGVDEGKAARIVLDRFSACTYKLRRARVDELLARPKAIESRNDFYHLASDECLSMGELRFDARLYRGALFNHAYRRRFPKLSPAIGSAAPISYPPNVDEIWSMGMPYADCVVRANPVGAHVLVVSSVGSKAEDEAFRSLSTAFGGCLTLGRQVKFSRTALRGFVAEAIFSLTAASVPTFASEKSR